MADLVVKADGTVVKRETNNIGSLPLKEGNVLDKPTSKANNTPGVSEFGSPAISTRSSAKLSVVPAISNNIGMADLVRILNEFSNTLKEVKESIYVIDREVTGSREDLTQLKKEIELIKNGLKSSSSPTKVTSCTVNNKTCGSATYSWGPSGSEITVVITLSSPNDICLFDTSFAKIDTSLNLTLEVDSKSINGKIIEKDNKYYLSFPKLDKYLDTPLEFVLPTI